MADDAIVELINDGGITQILEVWVSDATYDEYALVHIMGDGTVSIMGYNGSVTDTDQDNNLCIYDGGSTATIKNRLGAELTIKTILKE